MRAKTYLFSLIVLLSLFLYSCKSTEPKQNFQVISVYKGMSSYIESVQENSNADIETLFNEYVIDPYWSECVEGGEYISADYTVAEPIEDLDQLSIAIDKLRSSNVENIVEEALRKSAEQLRGPDTTVCIYALNPEETDIREYMSGVKGNTAGSGKIWMFIYPEENWIELTQYTIAHEYHHSVWTDDYYDPSKPFELIEYMVFEGRADSFAHIVYPDVIVPWVTFLTQEQEIEQWEAMQKYLDDTSYEIQARYMFGDGIIPLWTGYGIGYQIVQAYLANHPDETVEDWTALDAHELLEKSGYH